MTSLPPEDSVVTFLDHPTARPRRSFVHHHHQDAPRFWVQTSRLLKHEDWAAAPKLIDDSAWLYYAHEGVTWVRGCADAATVEALRAAFTLAEGTA